ncbi:type II toxin-antitoxin system HicB family antitoxin [Halomicrobium salinisoli]|uniref:type II toxin-antitoxin system HicB family antitoxin n=1 Tax=Halomicrobium salinisoli TaxID=2878391 RepID=UPI001CF0373E|nr:type II toxin-antitoxin system HicB family antitoxin [Halomicrobium salinisoli]
MDAGEEIRLTKDGDTDLWTAVDVERGVVSQGEAREAALENLDEAVEGHDGAGRPPTDEELRELGIDPEENTPGGELPDILT